jgi:hypothetical protein
MPYITTAFQIPYNKRYGSGSIANQGDNTNGPNDTNSIALTGTYL